MNKILNQKKYLVEVSPPKQRAPDLQKSLRLFSSKYERVIASGHCVSITDNAMGRLAFQGSEVIEELGFSAPPGQVLLHLNAFHTHEELQRNLDRAQKLGVQNLLVISGDGSERLPRLSPSDIGSKGTTVTSVELTSYIHQRWKGVFQTGVAFNQYEPRSYELEKLDRKLEAGAAFIITQPIVEEDTFLEELRKRGVPIFIEAWMSANVALLADCIGYDLPADSYDPLVQLQRLQERHGDCGIYLALMSFKYQGSQLLEEHEGEAVK